MQNCAPIHALALQDLNGPLRVQAEEIFIKKKEDWLHSLKQNRAVKNSTFSGNKVAEDEDKERERLCDTEDDNFTCASDAEETEAFPIDEARLDNLEVKGMIECIRKHLSVVSILLFSQAVNVRCCLYSHFMHDLRLIVAMQRSLK